MRFTKRFFDIQAKSFDNYSYEKDFIQGFCDNAPEGYNYNSDNETSCPWFFPWYADPSTVLYGENAYDAGAKYAQSVYNELQKILEEEKAYEQAYRD